MSRPRCVGLRLPSDSVREERRCEPGVLPRHSGVSRRLALVQHQGGRLPRSGGSRTRANGGRRYRRRSADVGRGSAGSRRQVAASRWHTPDYVDSLHASWVRQPRSWSLRRGVRGEGTNYSSGISTITRCAFLPLRGRPEGWGGILHRGSSRRGTGLPSALGSGRGGARVADSDALI
jgi:hypothetical protein